MPPRCPHDCAVKTKVMIGWAGPPQSVCVKSVQLGTSLSTSEEGDREEAGPSLASSAAQWHDSRMVTLKVLEALPLLSTTSRPRGTGDRASGAGPVGSAHQASSLLGLMHENG
jgi:hypothetical protein